MFTGHCWWCQFFSAHVFHTFLLDANYHCTIYVDALSGYSLHKFSFIQSTCCVMLCCLCSLFVSLVALISLRLISLYFSSLNAPRLIYLLLADIPRIVLQTCCNHVTCLVFRLSMSVIVHYTECSVKRNFLRCQICAFIYVFVCL